MKAMIFAAGLGTRLRPFTLTAPKALYPLNGKPLLYWTVRKLKESGTVDEIVVNVHHFASRIVDYMGSEEFLSMSEGLEVNVSDESGCLLETGGGMLHAEKYLAGGRFLMYNADIVSNADLSALCASHADASLATLLTSHRQTGRYLLFDDEMCLCGWYNTVTGEVRSPHAGLDPSRCLKLAFAGIHVASPGIFDAARRLGFSGKFSITDLYVSACASYRIMGHFQDGLLLADAGKPENIGKAERILVGMYPGNDR